MPFITISRQTGAGGHSFTWMLQGYLDMKWSLPESDWTVFDKNLVQTAMRERGLPERVAEYLSEKLVSEVSSLILELTGVRPSLWELNQLIFESLLHLAQIGRVILIGRGTNIVVRRLRNGLHIRLIGSL
tara:strand:+ start:1598 stop:1987 length:390 start_codon:yes stop_codon:yes gene_type:complete